jgi:outer membrane protein TolC
LGALGVLVGLSEEERAREREGELAASASELERTRARLAEAESTLALARGREQITASTFRALAEREYLALLGALGGIVGRALASSSGGNG